MNLIYNFVRPSYVWAQFDELNGIDGWRRHEKMNDEQ